MLIYFLEILFCFILFIFGFAFFEAFWRVFIAFWNLYKTKFPFAKDFIPFIGHLNLIQSGKCPFNFSNLSKEKTFCAFRGTHPCLITSDPKLIKQICIKYANYFHSRMIDPLSPNRYHSSDVHVFGASGHRWKRIRTITSTTFSTAKLRQMLPLILEQMDDFIIYLSNFLLKQNSIFYSSAEINIHFLFQQLTASVIGRCALGLDKNAFEYPPKHFKYFKQVFGPEPSTSLDFETFQWIIPTTVKIMSSISNAFWKSKINPINKLNDFIKKLLAKKLIENNKKSADILQNLKEFETFEDCYSETAKIDQNILNINNITTADKLNTDEIISTIRFLSIAGFDTTANTLSFACLLLAENPKKLQKVFEEIDSLKVVDKLDYDTLSKAVYINAVLMETLRLFPHASMLQSRLTLTDCIIDDEIIIPSGIGILFDTWKIHHDPLYWRSDVNEFQPERHFSSNMLTDYFFPFGIGPRQCIGMRFALMEQKAVLIQFFKHFTVKLPEGITSKDLYISLRNTGTVWPKDLKLIIEKRTHFPNPA